ncbi:LysR family transcriptional regulator [Alcanivorax hongdengensis A-11-3]|uniref:LysR family transcriptional regulator n=1 Tax=Alcanivorax hongdengensis A-11-3 TaxID=1177179 RepID=L0WHA0_9GAMM|nr:LysR family transcriptional regulator [Alcanivorax hongdengensis]EKF75502.1 LysR family transcriptional regulator [Alcanivorax hongdengensis A-11-3]
MQLRSLEMFVALAELGSFNGAAERLHTVQSNVSAHIKKLENELAVQLLARRNPAVLTPAGDQLLSYARQLLALHDRALDSFSPGGAVHGRLRLGSLETTAAVHLPRVLSAFSASHPAVQVTLTTAPSGDLLDALRGGQLDAALVGLDEVGTGLQSRPVFEEQLVLISGDPLPALPGPEQLGQLAFLSFRQGCSYRQRIEQWLAEAGVQAPHIHEFGSLDAIVGCVSAGMGVALVPATTAEHYRARSGLHSYPLPARLASVTTRLVMPPAAQCSRALLAFANGDWFAR